MATKKANKNQELSFDNTTTPKEVNANLIVPVIRQKTNTVINRSKSIGNESTLSSEILVKDLVLDLSYQRYPNETKVNKIVKNFDKGALGVIICSAREDGTIVILDGGHRIAAMRMMKLDDQFVDCLVYFGLTIPEEANLFNLINDNRTKPKTQDLFKAKVVAHDSSAVEIDKIFKKHNLSTSNQAGANLIRAVGTVSNLYKKNGSTNVDKTIEILKLAFGNHSSSFTDFALVSVSNMVSIYPNMDRNRLINALKLFGSISHWSNSGSIVSNQLKVKDRSIGMAIVAIRDYNKKLKTNRLDEKILW